MTAKTGTGIDTGIHTDVDATVDYANTRDSLEDQFFENLFGPTKVMLILRGLAPDDAVRRAEDAWDHGVRAVEVTVAERSHLDALEAVVAAARGRSATVGAGSIYRVAQVPIVAELGAAFTVAPGLSADVSRACREIALPHMPGVGTASEITAAEALGHTWLKAFPSRELGTAWFQAMRGPFPWPKWITTGGMDLDNSPAFLAAGARVIGMGTRIDDWSRAGHLLGD
ncbi:bifunctional 4-hydroxy-2-oxoglutarate aldolase/2-dehydro-3-deoxy-phosphogluconate aldolase [Compostimonas suwonensis]|uniref:2-dehydro-3-deoxyphosphogluconate aldolase/(4S)-4-hydroxy-2-oxoglutarate aldolase n=1 Tax=Compostimonas suwonensis TaxID=1048394 RepID=A0A2M9BBN3_9MICO|nr:bifunctional 4-hydroxy-2-oxoglutarate aldolase/2-dehydro-3-deoxy-phosphogluconate aldolase [Compostimonas suwonensis]PJJ55360.1 2-dehydro-3-deoxyphosphogluconate aldolase/(4S)-4-hydroxy-2-oxoglutarate aldolase [Compostimonas suwonensis]